MSSSLPPASVTAYDQLCVRACFGVYVYAVYVYTHPCSLSRLTMHTHEHSCAAFQNKTPFPVTNGLSSFANSLVLSLNFSSLRLLNCSCACTSPVPLPLLLDFLLVCYFTCVYGCVCTCMCVTHMRIYAGHVFCVCAKIWGCT